MDAATLKDVVDYMEASQAAMSSMRSEAELLRKRAEEAEAKVEVLEERLKPDFKKLEAPEPAETRAEEAEEESKEAAERLYRPLGKAAGIVARAERAGPVTNRPTPLRESDRRFFERMGIPVKTN
jgi:hypothetical protein